MTSTELILFLSSQRIPHSTESEMQGAIAAAFKRNNISFVREAKLSPIDRVDFMVGNIAIECKVKGQPLSIYRQLERYLKHDCVKELILVTSKYMGIPSTEKPIHVLQVGKAWL